MTEIIPYDQARIMLAEAKSVDDVKDIMDKAAAMAEYHRRASDRTLELDAVEIRMFAERRLGQMIAAQKAAVGFNKGSRSQLRGRHVSGAALTEPPEDHRPTLAEAGIVTKTGKSDTKLSAKAQKMAAIPPEQFKAKLSAWRAEALTADRVVTNLLHVGQKEEQAANRRDLASALADTSDQLLTGRKVPCVYIDPAWARKAGIGDRAYENHYPTEKWDGIIEIMTKAANRLQPNAWAFIWIPRAHMLALHPVKYKIAIDDGSVHEIEIKTPLIWAIARALGCTDYSTAFVWTKTDEDHPDEHGTFLIARDQDEILCLYKKGAGLPRPPSEFIYGSNHRERSRPLGHSVKPPFYRKMIADMVGCDRDGKPLPVLEMFCRHDEVNPFPENWEAWGNESKGEIQCATPADSTAAPMTDSQNADATDAMSPPAGTNLSTTAMMISTMTTISPSSASESSPKSESPESVDENSSVTALDPDRVIEDSPSEPADIPDDDLLVVKPLRLAR